MKTPSAYYSALASSYDILDSLRLENGLYLASSSSDYNYVWIRDSVYMSLPYLNKKCTTYEKTFHRLLDMFIEYEWKLDIHVKQKPIFPHEYIHSRFSAQDVRELPVPWGHAQHDAIGAFLWGIAAGHRRGKSMIRNYRDHTIIRKIIAYLDCCQYWHDPDNGMWEEAREVHASSIGACVAALREIKRFIGFDHGILTKGEHMLEDLSDCESITKDVDLAQLSLIYPYEVVSRDTAYRIIAKVESQLLKSRGVIRYKNDIYYGTENGSAEWTFGLPWLALCHAKLGNIKAAQTYIERTEDVMLENAIMPELYYAGTSTPNPNTPLGWSSAMYILAKENIGG